MATISRVSLASRSLLSTLPRGVAAASVRPVGARGVCMPPGPLLRPSNTEAPADHEAFDRSINTATPEAPFEPEGLTGEAALAELQREAVRRSAFGEVNPITGEIVDKAEAAKPKRRLLWSAIPRFNRFANRSSAE